MKRQLLIVLTFFLLQCTASMAQEDSVRHCIATAIGLMDNGEIAESKSMLKGVLKTHPDNTTAQYELGYAYYLEKDYPSALAIYRKLESAKGVDDLTYQMEGNTLDMMGKSDEAIATYERGLALFPKSGRLCLERGMMSQRKEEYHKALTFYERGIDVEPTFPSNYYRASFILMNSSEPVWGLVYGEIMINLLPESDRAKGLSRALYECYKQNIVYDKKTKSCQLNKLTENKTICMDSISGRLFVPFPLAFVLTLEDGVEEVTKKDTCITVSALAKMRECQVKVYFGQTKEGFDMGKIFHNVLFDYLKKVKDAGHLEAYNMWLFSQANTGEFNLWASQHEKEYMAFKRWIEVNPLVVNADNRFVRGYHTQGLVGRNLMKGKRDSK
jgi:tetratricopeptide (TPR) repeat protein